MNQILFQILLIFSRLPLKVLYLLSDVFYYLNFYIIGYRKKVVFDNLKKSFPEKSNKELKIIQKKFFKNFGDFLIETLKNFTMNQKESLACVNYVNLELYKKANQEKKDVLLISGHNFNWEFANVVSTLIPQENFHPIYRKLESKFWDEKVITSRERFGAKLLEAKEVMKHIRKTKSDGNSVYGFLADQTPHIARIQYGTEFLGQKTPIFTGYDRIASKDQDMLVTYAEITKIKRGLYQIKFKEIKPDHEEFAENELVLKFNKLLENTIKNHPENWLWTHKRWKYAHVLTDDMMIK